MPQFEVVTELDVIPTLQELKVAINAMTNHRSPGSDGLPAEIFKVLDDNTLLKFNDVISAGQRKLFLKILQILSLYNFTKTMVLEMTATTIGAYHCLT